MKTAKPLLRPLAYFACAMCLLLSLTDGRAQNARSTVTVPGIVELPELEVVGKRYRWIYIKTEHFELYSNLDDEKFIRHFAKLQNASCDLIKSQFQGFLSERTLQKKYILCYESTRKERFGVMERAAIEQLKGDQSIRFYTYEHKKGKLYGYRTNTPADATSLYAVLRDTTVDNVTPRRFLTQRMSLVFGDWFRLGLECMRRSLDNDAALEDNEYRVVFDSRTIAAARAAARRPAIAEMLDGFPGSPGPKTAAELTLNPHNGLVCFNFIYYCMFVNPERYKTPLANFLAWQEKHEPTEEAFIRIFGVNYRTMENEIREFFGRIYDRRNTNGFWILPLSNSSKKQKETASKIIISDVIRSQSSRLLSDIYFVAGDDVRSRQLLLKAAQEQPYVMNDPDFKAALALNELYTEGGDTDKAVLFLEELVQGNIQRPRIYAELAHQRIKATLPGRAAGWSVRTSSSAATGPTGLPKYDAFHSSFHMGEASPWLFNLRAQSRKIPAYRLSAEDTALAMEPLIKAFASYKSESLYVMLTAIWFLAEETPPENIINKIKEGCRLYPRNTVMLECAMDILKRNNKTDGMDTLLIKGFIYASKRNEAKVVDAAIGAYDIKEPVAERTKDGILREQLRRFDEVMQKTKPPALIQHP